LFLESLPGGGRKWLKPILIPKPECFWGLADRGKSATADGQRFGADRDAATSQDGSRKFKTTAIGMSTFLNALF
jgi:hypothetical protein